MSYAFPSRRWERIKLLARMTIMSDDNKLVITDTWEVYASFVHPMTNYLVFLREKTISSLLQSNLFVWLYSYQ